MGDCKRCQHLERASDWLAETIVMLEKTTIAMADHIMRMGCVSCPHTCAEKDLATDCTDLIIAHFIERVTRPPVKKSKTETGK